MHDEANVVMMLELEAKITKRILDTINQNIYNITKESIAPMILNDSTFIASLMRQVGERMKHVY